MYTSKFLFLFIAFFLIFSGNSIANTKAGLAFSSCDKQCSQMFSKLRKFASNGSPHAQTIIALAYKTGDGGAEIDHNKAWKWLRRASKQGFPPALHISSKWFRKGYETDINIEKANNYLRKAANADFGPAILDLGLLEYKEENKAVAIQLFEKAASMGSRDAKRILVKVNQLSAAKTDKKIITENIQNEIDSHRSNEEVLTILDNKMEPIELLSDILLNIADTGIYDRKGSTGSRVSDRKCGKGSTNCTSTSRDELKKIYFNY